MINKLLLNYDFSPIYYLKNIIALHVKYNQDGKFLISKNIRT